MSARLAGKTIAITGASSGLGRAMALRFAAEGAHVVVGDVRTDPREGGAPTVDVIAERGGSAEHLQCDASRWDDIDRLVRTALDHNGRLDVMVCNAGISGRWSKPLVETTEDPFDLRFALILLSFFDQRIAAVLLRRRKQLVLARAESVAMLELTWNRPCEILHDRPTRVGAELVAAREVEFFNCTEQGHVAIAHEFEEILIRPR